VGADAHRVELPTGQRQQRKMPGDPRWLCRRRRGGRPVDLRRWHPSALAEDGGDRRLRHHHQRQQRRASRSPERRPPTERP
jgi:hypothetical protein